jgi:hypothetical protein
MMTATTVSTDQCVLTASPALLRPSAAAAEALALADERAEDAEELPREREIEASLEAEDTIFEMKVGLGRYWTF